MRLIKECLTKIVYLLQYFGVYRPLFSKILRRGIYFTCLNENNGYRLSALKDDRRIASLFLNNSGSGPYPGWWIWSLEVDFLYRRLGIATRLIKNAIEIAKRNSAREVYLNARKEDAAVSLCYKRLGFRVIKTTEVLENNAKVTYDYMRLRIE